MQVTRTFTEKPGANGSTTGPPEFEIKHLQHVFRKTGRVFQEQETEEDPDAEGRRPGPRELAAHPTRAASVQAEQGPLGMFSFGHAMLKSLRVGERVSRLQVHRGSFVRSWPGW